MDRGWLKMLFGAGSDSDTSGVQEPRYSGLSSIGVAFDRETKRFVALTPEQIAAAGLTLPPKRFVADDRDMEKMATELRGKWFPSKIARTSHRNADGSSRQKLLKEMEAGDELELRPEPENPYDEHAVALVAPLVGQLGYLDKRLAGEFSRAIARGDQYRCFIREVTGGDGLTRGANIAVLKWTPE